jgi:hypothetical protein
MQFVHDGVGSGYWGDQAVPKRGFKSRKTGLSDVAASTRFVFHDDRLAHADRQALANGACHHVYRTTSGITHHHFDGFGGIGLRQSLTRQQASQQNRTDTFQNTHRRFLLEVKVR